MSVEASWVLCKPSAQQLAEINRLIEVKLKIHLETVLPLPEVKKAHQLSQSGRTRGKIVLQSGHGFGITGAPLDRLQLHSFLATAQSKIQTKKGKP